MNAEGTSTLHTEAAVRCLTDVLVYHMYVDLVLGMDTRQQRRNSDTKMNQKFEGMHNWAST